MSEKKALVRLFWLLNLNPNLVAHKQLFENLVSFFESRLFSDLRFVGADYRAYSNHKSCYRWPIDLPTWISTLKKVLSNAEALQVAIPKFDLARRSGRHHPMNRFGISRHPVTAALWPRHQSAKSYPPEPENQAANLYFRLQAHLCLSHIRSRAKIALSDILKYSGSTEHAPLSAGTGEISRVVRDCFHASHSLMLTDLALHLPPDDFLLHSGHAQLSRESVGTLPPGEAKEKFDKIALFFYGVRLDLLGIRKKRISHGHSTSREGNREMEYHPGCEPISEKIWVFTPLPDDDTEYPLNSGADVLIIPGGTAPDQPALDLESDDERLASGLAPKPKPAPTHKLYFPDEIGGVLRQCRLQALAVEMRSQALASDYGYLTDTEHFYIEQRLDEEINHYLGGDASRFNAAQVAFILKLIRQFGLSINQARSIQILDARAVEDADRVALIVDSGPQQSQLHWSLPALAPTYGAETNWDESLNRPHANRLVLPDFSSVGVQIVDYLQKAGRDTNHPFSLEEKTFKRLADKLLTAIGGPRLTVAKLRRTLEGRILERNRDPVITWFLSADQSQRGESRLYYARYPTATLVWAYRKASISILRAIGKPFKDKPTLFSPAIWQGPSIGCRFVITDDAVSRLVRVLAKKVKANIQSNVQESELIAYHNNFVLFVCLMQALLTYRSVNDPVDLIDCFKESDFLFPAATLSDKDNVEQESARLCLITKLLQDQFKHWLEHVLALDRRLEGAARQEKKRPSLFYLDEETKPQSITRSWIEAQFEQLGFKIPANFHRSFLRSSLIEQRCPAEVVDSFLGHASQGESPFAERSTFAYRRHQTRLSKALASVADSIGLKSLTSKLVA